MFVNQGHIASSRDRLAKNANQQVSCCQTTIQEFVKGKLSSHDMKFRLFVSLSYVFVCVCVFVCLVCLFVLLCISIILSEQVNDFAFSGIFEVEESHKELSICPRHKDDFGTRWLCNKKKKKCSRPSDWAPHGKSSRKGDRGMTL